MILYIPCTNRYKISQTQTCAEYVEVNRLSRIAEGSTKQCKEYEEAQYAVIGGEGTNNNTYSTAVAMRNNPTFQARLNNSNPDSMYV